MAPTEVVHGFLIAISKPVENWGIGDWKQALLAYLIRCEADVQMCEVQLANKNKRQWFCDDSLFFVSISLFTRMMDNDK